jgi:hypothetical protein
VTLTDAARKVRGIANIKKDGRYEIVLEQPCHRCSLKIERMGFVTQSKRGIEYNGSNSLWFGFVMKRSN